jgi:nicotinamide-nucleotide amidase
VNAAIIAVGSEMLTPLRVDTNSLAITERLNAIGCEVRWKIVVGDDVGELARTVGPALGAVDVLVFTGGLGPTEDDVTRDAVARALGIPLELDDALMEQIASRFAKRGLAMPAINRRQAMVPHGATVLPNPNGSAPGLWMEHDGTALVLLPGPPLEMIPMLEAVIRDRLAPRTSGAGLFRRVVRITGRTESDVDSVAEPIYRSWTSAAVPIRTTILAVLGQIELHLTASASSQAGADRALDSAVRELQSALGDSVFSTDGRPLESVVGDLLRERHWTVSAGESCTGGLLLSRLTDVPGSSDYVERGVVSYSDRAKVEWLGVPELLLREHGAVSEPVATAMAAGVRQRSGTDVGIGITGIAGPSGGTESKPVGTVAVAVVTVGATRVRTFHFIGGRNQIKYQSTQAALNMLRLMLIGRP